MAPLAWAHSALITARHSAAAALLPNGDIFIAGGVSDWPNTQTPKSESYTASDSEAAALARADMLVARSSHTITLLSNGKVLVAGGFNTAGTPLATAEIYNPLSNSWTSGVAMTRARGGHTATLLTKGANKGNVLICGGQALADPAATGGITNTCEIYSASGNSFSAAASMSVARMGHTASLMVGGRVFVAGGMLCDGATHLYVYTPMNEIYDPDAALWSGAAALNAGRAGHSAVVLNNGNILISGGFNNSNQYADPEEQWHKTYGLAQDAGSHGILGDAEMFDPSGLRVPVLKIMPYRNSRHSAMLMPDGTHHMHGGYGNIVPTFFSLTPTLAASSLTAVKTDLSTAAISGVSSIRFLLDTQLSRTVNGRIVDGDAFISPPATPVPSITVANAKIYLARSIAPLDGSVVGTVTGDPDAVPGYFSNEVELLTPSGRVYFEPEPSVAAKTARVSASNFVITPSTFLASGAAADLNAASTMGVAVKFPVSSLYTGGVISGTATIVSGGMKTADGFFDIVLDTGIAQLNGTVGSDGTVSTTLSFTGVGGTITNSTDTDKDFPQNANGKSIPDLTMSLAYTVTKIDLSGASYVFDTSTIVIRGMIFASDLTYDPKANTWTFGLLERPVFNHTALLTPAGDAVILGGQNCENFPACPRTAPKLEPITRLQAFIYQNEDWPASGKLNTKRTAHTSTLLPDGTILTCGGSDGANTLSSCELMDPSTTTWAYTGSMTYPRARHTATLLPNGTVLVTGGTMGVSTAATATAELYLPETKTWLPVKSMAYARQMHTATLLPDGNVLVAGGSANNLAATDTTEIFTSATSVWRTVTSMNTKRAQHTATLLKDGTVLAAGGLNAASGGAITSAEKYDPAADTWTPAASLKKARYNHTANLLKDGKVLVIGGSDNTGSLYTSELFDLSSWDYIGGLEPILMSFPRASHRSVLLPNGKVMVTGGEASGISHNTAESYDADFNQWSTAKSIAKRSDHTTILTTDGHLVNIGGWDGTQCLDTTDITYFSYPSDTAGLEPKNRNPVISTGTNRFDRGEAAVFTSSSANFHGITEASGGTGGSSSYHNPRVYMQQLDNPSGFMVELSTRIYSLYGGANTNWNTTLSQISIAMPSIAGELPYGWYNIRVAANGQFSPGYAVQVRHLSSPPTSSPCSDSDIGSVCGTSSPAQALSFSGELPNGMAVAVTVPAAAFKEVTRISISSSATGSCGSLPMEAAVYSTNNLPQAPLTLSMSYNNTIFPGIETTISNNLNNLVLARYSADSGKCLPLETRIDTVAKTITADLDHFSVFQLMIKSAALDFSAVRVYPNPLYINRGINMNIINLPASAKVRIYTLSGDKVWEGTASPSGDIHWRGVNTAGITVASGVYLAAIESSAGKKVLKIAVER